jgi:calcium-dependent protein kinase
MEPDITVKKTWFIKSKPGKIEEYYNFKADKDKPVGSGTYGNVFKATTKDTTQARAIKVIPKVKVRNQDRFKTEIEIMRNLDHPHIIKLFETFEDSRNIYLVMELCTGGELFDRIIEKGHFTESEARNIFSQIIKAIYYCHQNKICHRDLKPENFLLLDSRPDAPIKVIDFGLSQVFGEVQQKDGSKSQVQMTTRAGTPYYISPEVLQGKYDESCDVWSSGVILYILLCGYPPFYGNNDPQILEAVKKGAFDFNGPEWKSVSENAKDLIKKMLTKPEIRVKAGDILLHPWMTEKSAEGEKPLQVNFGSLKNFRNSEKLKKAALTYIASQLSESEISGLSRTFEGLDKNGDGVLTFEEIKGGLSGLSEKTAKEVQAVLDGIDTDQSGTINYTEFIAATMERNLYLKEEKLWSCFKMFDKDGSGKISAAELKDVLGEDTIGHDMSYWETMIKEADLNGDGEIDYNEFIKMMTATK